MATWPFMITDAPLLAWTIKQRGGGSVSTRKKHATILSCSLNASNIVSDFLWHYHRSNTHELCSHSNRPWRKRTSLLVCLGERIQILPRNSTTAGASLNSLMAGNIYLGRTQFLHKRWSFKIFPKSWKSLFYKRKNVSGYVYLSLYIRSIQADWPLQWERQHSQSVTQLPFSKTLIVWEPVWFKAMLLKRATDSS